LGRQRSEAVLHYDEAGSGLSSLTKRRLDHFGIEFEQSEVVAIDTIDNYCLANSIERIHLLKVDIEEKFMNNSGQRTSSRFGKIELGDTWLTTDCYFKVIFWPGKRRTNKSNSTIH
jgi:ATP-dependent exoDNAse (exonuclease V) beta subunit